MMKFLILFLCISSFQLSANVYSQIAKVSLEVKNASLEQVIQLLEKESGYIFLYEDAQIEQVLAGRPCSLEETVRGLIREQGRLYTERLLSAVLEAGFDYHALPVVMMGGGASVVSRHIRPSDGLCRTVTLLDDRVNAQGYERAVAALWGDDAQG